MSRRGTSSVRVGTVVRSVDVDSAADDALVPGDIIVEVNGAAPANAHDATFRMQKTKPGRPMLLKIERNGRTLYVAIERR